MHPTPECHKRRLQESLIVFSRTKYLPTTPIPPPAAPRQNVAKTVIPKTIHAVYSITYRMSDSTNKIIEISMSVNFLSNQPYTLEFHNDCCCFFRKLENSANTSCD